MDFPVLVLPPSPSSREPPQDPPINSFLVQGRLSAADLQRVFTEASPEQLFPGIASMWPHLEALPSSLVRKLILRLPSVTALVSYQSLIASSLLVTCAPTFYASGFPDTFQVFPLFVVANRRG